MPLEIVLYQDQTAKKVHQDLYRISDNSYLALSENVADAIVAAVSDHVVKMHVSAGWEAMLKVALWTNALPSIHDVLALLRKAGMNDSELAPFIRADFNDLFPFLYYSKRFPVLRRICAAAKSRIEGKVGKKNLLVHCHLVSYDPATIVSSSL